MIVLGVTWQRAEAAAIAIVAQHRAAITDRLLQLPSVQGITTVATCARVECYVDGTRFHEPMRAFIDEVAAALDVDPLIAEAWIDVRRGPDALRHLFEVTAGLQSAVVGEDQIVGQVAQALAQARIDGTVTRSLGMAFEQAIAVSRQARPLLGAHTRSLPGAALDRVGTVEQALVIGSGMLAEAAIDELRARGTLFIAQVSASGRRSANADAFVERDELVDALSLVDVVIACSGRGGLVIDGAVVDAAWNLRRTTLPIIDLTAGADVQIDIAANPEVELIGLDDLEGQVTEVGLRRAHAVIGEAVETLGPRIIDSDLDALITAMRDRVRSSVESSLDGCTDPAVQQAVHRVVQALLHEPTMRAREAARAGRLDEVRHAVGLLFERTGAVVS